MTAVLLGFCRSKICLFLSKKETYKQKKPVEGYYRGYYKSALETKK